MKVTGRFAPSPTGRLHGGKARTARLSWLQVRAAGGTFLLRIEDLDRARSRPDNLRALHEDLRYLGLDWDETPLVQSERQGVYDQALRQLTRAGRVYPCFCSRAEIANAVAAPHDPSDDGPRYPGTCAVLTLEQQEARARQRPAALRFRPNPGVTTFVDEVRGPFSQDVAESVGDFVVRRNDGVASYPLAVVVADAASGITHV
ncbi:MAG: glutamate--tRNA ligase family protein, partial [Myxococcaceae bacterium]